MKQQTARVINTHQTFNCTISEQYVRMCVRVSTVNWRGTDRDDIRIGTALSTLPNHGHSYEQRRDAQPKSLLWGANLQGGWGHGETRFLRGARDRVASEGHRREAGTVH